MLSNYRFVAHIDILGMRMMVRKDPELAWRVLSELANVRDYLAKLQLSFIETDEQLELTQSVFSVMFSDTIVLFTKSDSDRDLKLILIATSELLHKAMFRLVPVRAGLAHGLFFFNIDASMYSGPALIEAYEIGERAQWLGIVTTEAVWRQSMAADFKSGKDNVVVPAEIPTDDGLIAGYAVNWPAAHRHDFKVAIPISTESFYSQFEHAFGPFASLPERECAKYANTTRFINTCLEQNQLLHVKR